MSSQCKRVRTGRASKPGLDRIGQALITLGLLIMVVSFIPAVMNHVLWTGVFAVGLCGIPTILCRVVPDKW